MGSGIVIIGAGLAGWTTVREFRKLDPDTPVTVVTSDSGDFYAKPSLSNAFAQGRTPAQLVTTPAAKMAETHRVKVQSGTQVVSIDPVARILTTHHGAIPYDQLVLATGAQPIRVPVAGDAADQVQSINALAHFSEFHARLTQAPVAGRARRVLIMGAGLIGCEFANDLAVSGFEVTVVDPAAVPIAALLPPDASVSLRDALSNLGVAWQFGVTVVAVHQVADSVGSPLQVELSNGQILAADSILSAIGLRPDTALAQATGLVCERGIAVDLFLQTSDPHIHALGDAAQYCAGRWSDGAVTGGRTLPYVMPIMNAAKALAATLAGSRSEVVFPVMPVTIKTPALPLVVALPPPGTAGEWRSSEAGVWQFVDSKEQIHGFVLCGNQTPRRAEQLRLLSAHNEHARSPSAVQ